MARQDNTADYAGNGASPQVSSPTVPGKGAPPQQSGNIPPQGYAPPGYGVPPPMSVPAGYGVPIPVPVSVRTEPERKSRVLYVILCFFFGGLGIHDFYAGLVSAGVGHFLFWGLSSVLVGASFFFGENPNGVLPRDFPFILLVSGLFLIGINQLWVLVELFAVNKDGKGVPMK